VKLKSGEDRPKPAARSALPINGNIWRLGGGSDGARILDDYILYRLIKPFASEWQTNRTELASA
jgi:hypothetical protein